MDKDTSNIFGRRLNQARLIKGISMEELGRSVQPSVSRQAINKYEKGQTIPDSLMLISLGKVLGVKPDYFFRPFTVEVDKVIFRKRRKFSEKDVLSVKEKAREELERYLEAEQLSGTSSSLNFPHGYISNDNDVIAFANSIRQKLGLGIDGISNVIEILEENGIKIIEVSESDSFGGLSGYANDNIPLIVINCNLIPERKRFTLLHEFGHLFMMFGTDASNKVIEDSCNTFAREMLLPSEVLKLRLGNSRHDISLAELTDIQKQYGISIDSIMESLVHNGVITGRRYEGYLKKKKLFPDFKSSVERSLAISETSGRFVRMVYRALADEIISFSKAAALLNTSVDNVKAKLQLVCTNEDNS
ncbi:ImmA/IrrE family metallo-endopeptidase [Muribaculum gordoncarteri]|jgi:Zn-dependent peptidase ImmA (M78 family)/transcriptional regulator with XRE-family HTH domain|uniref:ImmA/IrrE family metallo-endopeptidase n=4 Tax=Bacteroidales TaxID=171549 RepID=A0A4P7VNT0_9BACT|nr:XRE family transcriptional regulator [Muribaculum gordoncarteri]QCD35645.1 ImmA/IrrE family metallo-endopeptidase [Muribaculum gordoncarteri]